MFDSKMDEHDGKWHIEVDFDTEYLRNMWLKRRMYEGEPYATALQSVKDIPDDLVSLAVETWFLFHAHGGYKDMYRETVRPYRHLPPEALAHKVAYMRELRLGDLRAEQQSLNDGDYGIIHIRHVAPASSPDDDK